MVYGEIEERAGRVKNEPVRRGRIKLGNSEEKKR